MSPTNFGNTRRGFAYFAIVFAILSIAYILVYPKCECARYLLAAWTIGVPVYFFAEYWVADTGKVHFIDAKKEQETLEELKIYSDYLRNIWAGVIAVMAAFIIASA